MARAAANEENVSGAWTADVFGPIFRKRSLTLREALDVRNVNERTRLMATFVPDVIMHEIDSPAKRTLQTITAVLSSFDVSGFATLLKKYTCGENGGSPAFSAITSDYIRTVTRQVYGSKGDILQFSTQGLLVMWKVHHGDFISKIVESAIICAIRVQNSMALFENNGVSKAGDVTFSIIGNDECRNFVIFGKPIDELKYAKRVCLPNDLVLSSSAWKHCTPSRYEYVIKDSCNVQIIGISERLKTQVTCTRAMIPVDESDTKKRTTSTIDSNVYAKLRSYLTKQVIRQIEKRLPLEYLAEIREITSISLDIVLNDSSIDRTIFTANKCFGFLHNIVIRHAGWINTVNLCGNNISFSIVFGIDECDDETKHFQTNNAAENGIACAMEILKRTRNVTEVQGVFIGVSTGICYHGVIGHATRKHHAVIGCSVDRATEIMNVFYDKIQHAIKRIPSFERIFCDYNTVSHSRLNKDLFRCRGFKVLRQSGEFHVHEYLGVAKGRDASSSCDHYYPILGRSEEMQCFDDILNDAGLSTRNYSALLIKGSERSGKSRLLDALVRKVRDRRIMPIKLSLHASYAEKPYSVVHRVILQILEAEKCDTMESRENALYSKLSHILVPEEFCYLNIPMRVRFPLSDVYCSESDWRRHAKTINIFEAILKQLKRQICILLDDVHYMDRMSWQYLSAALDNGNVVMAMTMLETSSREDMSRVQIQIGKDERLMKRSLGGLDDDLLSAFACQFLNVSAIPSRLNSVLRQSANGDIARCEMFLVLILQSDALDFIRMSPVQTGQHDLVFPSRSLLAKLPIYSTREETAAISYRLQDNHVNVCVTNERYADFHTFHDTRGLIREIYERMTPYERSFITCAATLGMVFERSILHDVMPDANPLHTAETVSEMMRIRILECAAVQRQSSGCEDFAFGEFKERKTFSDMHHSVSCDCDTSHINDEQSPSLYARCKLHEFKADIFRKVIYGVQSNEQRQEHHARAADAYRPYARKCTFCGGGNFLKFPSKQFSTKGKRRRKLSRAKVTVEEENDKSAIAGRDITLENIVVAKKRESVDIRGVSIMPTYLDGDENEGTTADPSHPNCLREFRHVDYRGCQCDSIVDCLFWKLHQHTQNGGKRKKTQNFLLEYSAGLIETMQLSYAIQLLSIAAEKYEWNERITDKAVDYNRGITLAMTGDAYSALGNYARAKKYYKAAVTLQNALPAKRIKPICFASIAFYHKMQALSRDSVHDVSRLELASHLRRLSIPLMMENKGKAAISLVLRSAKLGFASVGSFFEKGQIYLAAVRVLRCTTNARLTRCIEQLMLNALRAKSNWTDPDEVAIAADIYLTMYRSRALKGELEDAVNMGVKVLKISAELHFDKLTLIVLPSLIEIMLWTQRVAEAVDSMRQLYFLAEHDIDLSAKTWYYALSLQFILDAGVVVEPYERCLDYYEIFLAYRSKSCVSRDPQSLCRLLTCLSIYQLRMRYTVADTVVYNAQAYTKDVTHCDFSRILTCSKALEYYLLRLLRYVNMKRSAELLDLIRDVRVIAKCLRNVSGRAMVVKPRFYLLLAYSNVIRGRTSISRFYLRKANKFAISQGNKLSEAWITQNKRTWLEKIHNNTARYWLERAGSMDTVAWQYVCKFNILTWSSILYPLPKPDSYL